jgi:xylulose-5-phosphate/fructose-6-phosphate phosphoketolase
MIRSTEEKTVKKAMAIICVFLGIGGVLLTNDWDHHARKRAATNFKLDLAERENRHHPTFDTYVEGKLTIWPWASNDQGVAPDVVMACCGDVPTLETLAAVSITREHLPDL